MGDVIQIESKAFVDGVSLSLGEFRALGESWVVATGSRVRDRAESNAPRHLGALRSSIYLKPLAHDRNGVYVVVGTDDPVGFYQEFGTRKMRAHPWLRPAMASERGVSFAGSTVRLAGTAASKVARSRGLARQRVRRATVRARRTARRPGG